MDYVQDYFAGSISREAFGQLAKFKYLTHQISFHTLKALACLTYERSELLNEERNDVLYVCSLLEFTARRTKNKISDLIKKIGENEIKRQLELAEVNHCLSFEQVSEELIEAFGIEQGNFDCVGTCLYQVPSHIAIGKDYQRLIEDVQKEENIATVLYKAMTSFITEEISNFNSSVYYSSREYLKACYENGEILD